MEYMYLDFSSSESSELDDNTLHSTMCFRSCDKWSRNSMENLFRNMGKNIASKHLGFVPLTAFVGAAVETASAQNLWGRLTSSNIDRADSTSVRSATPFCSGVLEIVRLWRIPSPLKYSSNWLDVYSPPLSVRKVFNFFPIDFSSAFHLYKVIEDFVFSG